MELIKGSSLDALFAYAPPPLRVRIEWCRQLAEVLSYLHANNVLHRDVKPHNVLIDHQSQSLFLTDFGVAHWDTFAVQYSADISTLSSEILTTWNYLAPEVELEPKRYGKAAETWSFAKTAIEILAWRALPRVSLLTGQTSIDIIPQWPILAEALGSLLNNRPGARKGIVSWSETCIRYLRILDGLAALDSSNYAHVAACVRKYIENERFDAGEINNRIKYFNTQAEDGRDDLQKGRHQYWRLREQPFDVFGHILRRRDLPDDFVHLGGFYPTPCKRCGSRFRVEWAAKNRGDSGEDWTEWCIVCLGVAGQPCGHIENHAYEEDVGIYSMDKVGKVFAL